jgi:hypothetical protein
VTEGKRCSKCSNMRPRSYYVGNEGTCRWHLPQRQAASLRLQAMRRESQNLGRTGSGETKSSSGAAVTPAAASPSTDA